MFNNKYKKTYIVGAVLLGALSACSSEKDTLDNDIITDKDIIDNKDIVIEQNKIEIEDYSTEEEYIITDSVDLKESTKEYLENLKQYYEENKLSDEEVEDIYNMFKDEVVNAPENFVNSVNGVKDFIVNNFLDKQEVEENYIYIDQDSEAYYICMYIDNYVNKNVYTSDDIDNIISITNKIIFSDQVVNYTSKEKEYIYQSLSNLVEKLELYLLDIEDYIYFQDISNKEYITYIKIVIEETARDNEKTRK